MMAKDLDSLLLDRSQPFDTKDYQAQLLAEYNALRSEAIQRMDKRHQIVTFSVVVLGAILAFDAPVSTLLAYPILGLFLALGWAHNDFRIGEIGEYVRTRIETQLPGLNWETHFSDLKKRRQPFRYVLRATILSAGGVIVGTQLIALIILYLKATTPPNRWLVGINIGAILLTVVILHWRKLLYRRKKTDETEQSN